MGPAFLAAGVTTIRDTGVAIIVIPVLCDAFGE
jgi:hypothetical protein